MDQRASPRSSILSDIGWVIGPVILFLMAFTVWCWGMLAGFEGHREGLTRRLSWLSELQGTQARLAAYRGPDEILQVDRLLTHAEGLTQEVEDVEGAQVLETSLVLGEIRRFRALAADPLPQSEPARLSLISSLSEMIFTLQEASRRDAQELERRWSSLYVLAVVAILLAISNIVGLGYLWTQSQRLRSSSRALETVASRDALTGLLNRRESIRQAKHLLDEARYREVPLTLCLVELDRFASVNEVHGYYVGDEAIRTASRRILGSVRAGDPVGRVGGDEFLVLLTGCHRLEAQRVAERIRRAFEDEEEVGEVVLRTTVSVGAVVVYPADVRSVDDLLKLASQSLTQAKLEGRNRVRIRELSAPDLKPEGDPRLDASPVEGEPGLTLA